MPKDKIQQDAIKFLESIITIADRIKNKIEEEDLAIDYVNLSDIIKVDSDLDLVHCYLLENKE